MTERSAKASKGARSSESKVDPTLLRLPGSGAARTRERSGSTLRLGDGRPGSGKVTGSSKTRPGERKGKPSAKPGEGSEPEGKPASNKGLLGLLGLAGVAGIGWLLFRPGEAQASTGGSSGSSTGSAKTDDTKPKPSGNRKFGKRVKGDGPQPRPNRPTTRDPDGPPARGRDEPAPSEDGPTLGELVVEYPEGGGFYQALYGDTLGGTRSSSIAKRYLLSEGFLAAKEYGGLSDDDARAWAADLAARGSMRIAAMDLIQCSGWNDTMYGAEPRRGTRVSATGRSILLLPRHAPIGEQLAAGDSPARNIQAESGAGVHDDWRNLEFLWLPAINRRVLWDSSGETLTTEGQVWPDGNSKHNPPAWVMGLGVIDESGDLENFETLGCPGSDGELV